MSNNKIKNVLVVPDLQVPYEDKRSLAAVEQVMGDHSWDEIVQLGDFLDLDCISTHNTNKLRTIAGKTIQKDFDAGNAILDRWERLAPKAKITVIEGNHDERMLRYLDANPQLIGALEVPKGLRLKERGINWVPYWSEGDHYRIGNAYFIHGQYTNEWHSKKHVSRWGVNVFYGHCMSDDTEILTKHGWEKRCGIIPGLTEVLTLNKSTLQMEWNVVKTLHTYTDYTNLLHIKGDHTDLLVTDLHGLIAYRSGKKSLEEFTANHFLNKKSGRILIHGGVLQKQGIALSDSELQLAVWIAAEGHKTKHNGVSFGLKKDRKVARLSKLLNFLGISYSKTFRSGEWWFHFNLWQTPELDTLFMGPKQLPPSFIHCTPEQAKVVFTEYGHTDGHIRADSRSIRCYTAKKDEADTLQIMAITSGYKCSISIQHNEEKNPNANPLYVLNINPRNYTWIQQQHKPVNTVPYKGTVWCPTVANGTIVIRRNGKVAITQNTHDVQCYPLVLRGEDKTIVGQSLGCLCRYDQSYLQGAPTNWQQAFAAFHFLPDGFFTYNVVRIFRHRFVYERKVYQG